MKKLLFSVIAVAISMASMATETAFVRVSFSSVAHATDGSCEIKLVENDARTSAYESGYDAKSMATLSNDYSVLFYGFVGSEKCSDIATNDLTGLALGFTTNNVDTEYKLSFRLFSGNEFYIYDRVKHQAILVNASTPDYTFEAAAGRVEVNDRFVIGVPAAYTVTPKGSGYASFSATEATVIPGGVTVYKAEYDGVSVLTLTAIDDYIPANTGVIVAGTADVDYNFAVVTDPAAVMPDMSGNNLKPSTAFDGTGEIYCLRHVGSESAFYQYTGATMPANKAFLKLVGGAAAAPKRISMHINGEQGIENTQIEVVEIEKFIENGQVFIKRGEAVYNLQGQMVK